MLENPSVIKANALANHRKTLVAFQGMYCRLRLHASNGTKALVEHLQGLNPNTPLIISSLFKWERQVSMCHARLKLHNDNEANVESNRIYEIHAGFRRLRANMLFSKVFRNCDKSKFARVVDSYDDIYLGSFYGQIYFPPKKVAVFSLNPNGTIKCLSMAGQMEYPDPFRVILKRIVLTGYPCKVEAIYLDLEATRCGPVHVLQP